MKIHKSKARRIDTLTKLLTKCKIRVKRDEINWSWNGVNCEKCLNEKN
tara:strand:- start:1392 stop:1535 length:144 start_codon:yes stop_codon:yes gene_type:complete